MRYAIYYTPPRDHPLTRAAAGWLGRDAFSGRTLPHGESGGLAPEEIAYFTAAPRRYGFHATLKSPFRLADGFVESDVLSMAERLSGDLEPVVIPKVTIARLGGFFAIVPEEPNAALNEFAGCIVAMFDKLRAPLTEKEFERRNPETLSTAQLRNLQNWGYPYVFDEFRFHMTLTGHVEPVARARIQAALDRHFSAVLADRLTVDHVAVFIEREQGAPFEVHSLFPIGAGSRRRSA